MELVDRVFKNKKIKEKFVELFKNLKQEGNETKEMMNLITKYVETGSISDEESDKIREQLIDMLKLSGHLTIFMLPFGSLLIPFLIKISKKLNIDILPSSFKEEIIPKK